MTQEEVKELIEGFRSKYGQLIDELTAKINTMIRERDGDSLALMLTYLQGLADIIRQHLPESIDPRGLRPRNN